jgi:YjbE family integral membrane protein
MIPTKAEWGMSRIPDPLRFAMDRIAQRHFSSARAADRIGRMFATPEFVTALAAIVVIDLVLAGDNAIVIALAARNLPKALQRRAVIWGTVGAVAVRASLTVAVLWLLEVPGLMGAGGVLLAWIAYRLLAGDDGGKDHDITAAAGFWGAMRTIVIADAVMGLDNVLAVAGAAHGSVLLVVVGLLISIPIVVWGSTLILNWIERFPALLYIGGGVLAWTAAKMLADEPLLQQPLDARPGLKAALYAVVIGGVLGFAWLRNRSVAAAQETARKEAMQ